MSDAAAQLDTCVSHQSEQRLEESEHVTSGVRPLFRRLRTFAQPTTYLGVAVIATIWCGVFFLTNQERERAYEDGIRQGTNLARVFKEYISRVIGGADSVLLTLREAYGQNTRQIDIAHLLRYSQLQNNGVLQYAIIGADGRFKFSTLRQIASNANADADVSDREYFRFQANSTADKIYISEPLVGRLSGRPLFQLTRRITAADGSFGGVIAATIDIIQLETFYNSIDIGHGGIISLVGFDGVIRARSGRDPVAKEFVGQSVPQTKLFELYRKSPAGHYWNFENAKRHFEGIRRLISYRVVDGFPLVAVVGLAEADMYQQSTLTAYKYYLIALVLTALVLVAIWIGATRQKTLLFTMTALERSNRSLEQTNLWFNSALENMPQGLIMFNSAAQLVVCNDRYRRTYNLPTDLAKPGCAVVDLLKQRSVNGTFTGDPEKYVSDLLAKIVEGKPAKQEVEIDDGRVISVVNQPMATGGWVATHEDVTGQRRSEQALDETKAFLDSIIANIPISVVVKDAKTCEIMLTNRVFEDMIGLPRNALIGKTAFDIYRTEDAKRMDALDRQCVENGVGININEFEAVTPSLGPRIFSTKRIVVPDKRNVTKYLIVVIDDITERKTSEQRMFFMAHHDALTGLANRVTVAQRIEEAAARQRRHGDSFSVLQLDLDRFKQVNDSLGHAAGDALLWEVGARLKAILRETDVLARLGGDEFAIIQEGAGNQREAASTLAERIFEALRQPFNLEGHEITIGTSIGVALAPEHASDAESLLKMADMALYCAKSAGRNGYRFFSSEMSDAANTRHELENELRRAIQNDEFELHYQPIVEAKTRKICGAEALIRWRHPTKGTIPPDRFIPLAEETGLIAQIGEWVLQTACKEAATWPAAVKLAVNLSPVQFRKLNLTDVVMCALAQSGLPPERLELEITETALIESAAECLPALRQFKNLGITVALDDFGTGYSSLSLLTMFHFDKIKIDKSFIQNMTKRAEYDAIISATLTLAQTLGVATTAEGVETKDQYRLLRLAGVTSLQGYLFERPGQACEINFDRIYGTLEMEDAA
jgi:diguanylate cyclase (GGDEF)-like protein/PAS domain S-box-containing protein